MVLIRGLSMTTSDPYQGTVNCHWCEVEDRNAGMEPVGIKAVCKASGPFEGEFACERHGDLLLISGWYGGLLPEPDDATAILMDAYDKGS